MKNGKPARGDIIVALPGLVSRKTGDGAAGRPFPTLPDAGVKPPQLPHAEPALPELPHAQEPAASLPRAPDATGLKGGEEEC